MYLEVSFKLVNCRPTQNLVFVRNVQNVEKKTLHSYIIALVTGIVLAYLLPCVFAVK